MTSGAKTIKLRLSLIEERYRGMKRAPERFLYEFFQAIILLEIIAIICEIFLKCDHW